MIGLNIVLDINMECYKLITILGHKRNPLNFKPHVKSRSETFREAGLQGRNALGLK